MDTSSGKFGVAAVDTASVPPSVSLASKVTSDEAHPVKAEHTEAASDAVKVSLQMVDSLPEGKAEETSTTTEEKQQAEMSYEQARKVAEEIQEAINSSHETVVKFRVSLIEEDSKSQFKFQVVDKNTGEIVRQFPPEDILGMAHKMTGKHAGVVVDNAA